SALAAFLAEHGESGVRYVALVFGGAITASAGEPAGPPAPAPREAAGERPVLEVDGRLRAYFPRPPMRTELLRVRDGDGDTRRMRGRDPAGARWPSFYVIEFDPVVATGLVNRA